MTPSNQIPRWKWIQPEALRRYHELWVGGERHATLSFDKTWGGSLATAQCQYGSWTLKRNGFLSPVITIRAQGSDQDLAVFRPQFAGGGELRFADGRGFTMKSLSLWGGDWVFEDPTGGPVLTLHGPHGFLKNAGEVTINPGAVDWSAMYLLAVLVWYVNLLMAEDTAAVSCATIACM